MERGSGAVYKDFHYYIMSSDSVSIFAPCQDLNLAYGVSTEYLVCAFADGRVALGSD